MSDDGSDDNDCHSGSSPCKNLQTVLNRATDVADIYVTSPTLSINSTDCALHSNTSHNISSLDISAINVVCSGKENF